MIDAIRHAETNCRYQSGMVTTFTGVLILVLLTLMMFFAMRVGVFEQRVSSNEMRQKAAFHAAESGLNHAKEFFRSGINRPFIAKYGDVNGVDGWLSDTSAKRWQKCSDWAAANSVDLATDRGSHPCFGEPSPVQRAETYFYSFNGSTEVPVDTDAILAGTTEDVAVEALLCVLEVDEEAGIPVQGCSTDPNVANGEFALITLLARGQADCDGGTCNAEALVRDQLANFGPSAGGRSPKVPLTTRSSFPPSGTAEVVPNPNAGGIGVPVSVWMNGNASCGVDGSAIDPSSGSWATCEYHEWYGVDVLPDDYACPGNCSCSEAESLSYTKSTNDILGIDLVQDPLFPCDLFQFYFGVPRTEYQSVKAYAKQISNCSGLGPTSSGIYWVSGTECRINSNTQVGSPDAPVMLISATGLTRLNGGAKIYGTLFITDVEVANAELQSNGTNQVYGSVIVDGILGSYQGTFQVVWNDYTSRRAGNDGQLGAVVGGWSDFHRDWE